MHSSTIETLSQALLVAEEYGGNLTVRQLYYRLVALGMIENSDRSYKRLVKILSNARMSGDFPFEWLIDRTRQCREGDFSIDQTDPDRALKSIADQIKEAPQTWVWRSRWLGQENHVSVWVEKEALAGVFEGPCEELGVSWFVLRGYSSLSALSQWVDTVSSAWKSSRFDRAVVLYFGDHDPDGWEIPRSAERNVHQIAETRGIMLPYTKFKRVALNRGQIEEFDPPPFPAKISSSRYETYVSEHGTDSAWELDALRPDLLDTLIRDSVSELFDEDLHEDNEDKTEAVRREVRRAMRSPGWMDSVLGEG